MIVERINVSQGSPLKRATKMKEPVKDYSLTRNGGRKVKLFTLFGDKEELILVHNMGTGCEYCTMWADGFNGVLNHLEDRAAFAVGSPNSSAVQEKFAESRGWKFKMVSHKGTSFNQELGFEKNGKQVPGVSVFKKTRNGRIVRVAKDVFGPGDDYCITWHFFDLLPGGIKDWEPKFTYG